MTLAGFIFFLLGVFVELLWLYDLAHPSAGQTVWPRALQLSKTRPTQAWAALLFIIALGLVGLLRLVGWDTASVSLDDNWVGVIFVGLGLFLLAAGLIADLLVPRVNESIILGVLLMGLFDLLVRPPEVWSPVVWGLGGLQAGLALLLIFYSQPLSLTGRALAYLIYLLTLFCQAFFRPDTTTLFTLAELNWREAFLFGAVFVFLLLHALLFLRFVLIVSSLILPANRPLLVYIIPRLFSTEQVALWRVAAACAVLIVVLVVNRFTGLVADSLLVSFSLAAGVQALLRPGFGRRADTI